MGYSLHDLARRLAADGIKEVVMRHDGREGAAEIQSVNFLGRRGRFLSYAEIERLNLPENEVFGIGLEMLAHAKHDWADDWGGRGEIRWVPGGRTRILHQDRRVVEKTNDVVLTRDALQSLASGAVPAGVEIDRIEQIDVSFDYEGGIPVFDGHSAVCNEENIQMSPALIEASDRMLSTVIRRMRSERDVLYNLSSGHVSWKPDEACRLLATCSEEAYERLFFTIASDCDISL